MAESKEDTKAQLPGTKRSFKLWSRKDSVIAGVDFSQLPIDPSQIGVTYTVISTLNPVTFRKKGEALRFKALLKASINPIPSDIVRKEYTKEGFEV